MRNSVRADRVLVNYTVTCVGYLFLLLIGATPATDVLKPLLMPRLAVALSASAHPVRLPRLLLGALLASCAGDTFLLFGGAWFLVGMGGFAAAHVCYVAFFVRRGALRDRRRLLRTAAPYAVLWVLLITLLWPDLASGLRIPLAGYSLLLTGTAVSSACAGRRTGLGGALFLLSDSLIASGLAHWPQLPVADVWVMATYLLGQYLLASGATADPPMGGVGPTVEGEVGGSVVLSSG